MTQNVGLFKMLIMKDNQEKMRSMYPGVLGKAAGAQKADKDK